MLPSVTPRGHASGMPVANSVGSNAMLATNATRRAVARTTGGARCAGSSSARSTGGTRELS
jgi:hypothetical protein